MSWWNRITNVVVESSSGDCGCHEPGQLHQVEFTIDREQVRVMEDKTSGEYFVAFNGRTIGQYLNRDEMHRLVSAHFGDGADDAFNALPGF